MTFTPEELDTLIVWKEGATPQPNPNPARPPPPPASSVLAEGQPLPFVPSSSEDIAASGEATATGEEGEEKWPEGMPKVRECGVVCGGTLDLTVFCGKNSVYVSCLKPKVAGMSGDLPEHSPPPLKSHPTSPLLQYHCLVPRSLARSAGERLNTFCHVIDVNVYLH